jgi:hypothetical protein
MVESREQQKERLIDTFAEARYHQAWRALKEAQAAFYACEELGHFQVDAGDLLLKTTEHFLARLRDYLDTAQTRAVQAGM